MALTPVPPGGGGGGGGGGPDEPVLWIGPRTKRPEETAPPKTSSAAGWIVASLFAGAAIGGSCSTCLGGAGAVGRDDVVAGSKDHVGVIELEGEIMDSSEVVKNLRDFSRRDDLQAIVFRINSPGGAVAPSQEIYDAVRRASKAKPVVVSMATVAASGGYWSALGGDWIFAQPGSVTGSIGVITQIPDVHELAALIHVRVHTFKSGKLKDTGNPFREINDDDRELFQALIADLYAQFVEIVAERRHLDVEVVKKLADGRVMTGRAAMKAGLVDELGGLTEAAKKAVVLAKARHDEGTTKTSTVVPADLEDPTLIYPSKPKSVLQMLTDGASTAISDGISGGVDRASRSLTSGSGGVELR